jgi:hypothetical protein
VETSLTPFLPQSLDLVIVPLGASIASAFDPTAAGTAYPRSGRVLGHADAVGHRASAGMLPGQQEGLRLDQADWPNSAAPKRLWSLREECAGLEA